MRTSILFLLLLCCTTLSMAQINTNQVRIQQVKFRLDSLDYHIHKASHLLLENHFMNRVVYSGRDYGLTGFGTSTQLTYNHKSGIFLTAGSYYWQKAQNKFPKVDATIGYATSLDERLSASFAYSHSLYLGASAEQLRWVTTDFLSTYWTIDVGFMGISPSFYYQVGKSGNTAQFAITGSKYKELKQLFLGGKLIFEPNFTWMISSRDRFDGDRPDGKVVRVINYEAVLPVTYRRVGVFDFSPKLHWTLPINVLRYDGAIENKSFFYFTANVKWMLWHKISDE